MCGRYTLYKTSELEKRFKTRPPAFTLHDSYNVAPGQMLPVIIQSEHGRTIEPMKWGLVPMWAKDINIGYKMINAREDGIFDKPAWRGPIRHHRCLVPATGFYEWKHLDGKKTKQPYFIKPKDQELFAFAGIFDVWHDKVTGSELWSYSIITTEPNKEMTAIHDRMPVILHPDDWDVWLSPSLDDRGAIEALLRPYGDGTLEMYEVSSDVNIVKNNDNKLIYPLNSQ
jgi:putative SOS response-associated peptidase YedK